MEDGLRSRQKKFDDDLSLATETLATFHDSGDPEKVFPTSSGRVFIMNTIPHADLEPFRQK